MNCQYKKNKKIPTSISLEAYIRDYVKAEAAKADLSVSYYIENLIVNEMRNNGYYDNRKRGF